MVIVCWWTSRGLEDTGVGVAGAAAAAELVGSGIEGLGPFGVEVTVDCRNWKIWRRA